MFCVRHAVKLRATWRVPDMQRPPRACKRRHHAAPSSCAEIQGNGTNQQLSAFDEHKDELEHFEQMYGRDARPSGRSPGSHDQRTGPRRPARRVLHQPAQPNVPAMDLRMIDQELAHAKELVQSVMEEFRNKKPV